MTARLPSSASRAKRTACCTWANSGLYLLVGPNPDKDPQDLSERGETPYAPVLATDGFLGDVVMAWHTRGRQNAPINYLQIVFPEVGPKLAVPLADEEAPAIAGRPGAFGIYTVTTNGSVIRLYRAEDRGVNWELRLIPGPPVPVLEGTVVKQVGLCSGPDERLWLAWGNEDRIFAARTSSNVTRFEPVTSLRTPAGSLTLDRLECQGSAGPLDLLADLEFATPGKAGAYHTQVLPQLTVSEQIARFEATGTKVTFTVTDAGEPLPGAKVRFEGKTLTTNRAGRVTVTTRVGRGGRLAASASIAGYLGEKLECSVTTKGNSCINSGSSSSGGGGGGGGRT